LHISPPVAAKFFRARALRAALDLDVDVLFVRYPLGLDLDPTALLRRRPCAIVSMHHTKEVEELLTAGRSASTLARVAFEWVQGARYLRSVDGVVGVTEEIRDYEVRRSGTRAPAFVISNGTDVDAIPATGCLRFEGPELALLFVASAPSAWHGLDRLQAGLAAYSGPARVVLHVVGEGFSPEGRAHATLGNAHVHYHGRLEGEALDVLAARCHLGISTLAAFRKGLRQACALKTREYIARGLPFVYGYEDPDVPVDWPYALRVDATPSAVSITDIVSFAERMANAFDVARQMRAYGHMKLDWSVKVREMASVGEAIALRRGRLLAHGAA
jgi:hypothetical protein